MNKRRILSTLRGLHITAIQNADSLYNIDRYQTSWEDLRKPLYSAMATYLHIFDQVFKMGKAHDYRCLYDYYINITGIQNSLIYYLHCVGYTKVKRD